MGSRTRHPSTHPSHLSSQPERLSSSREGPGDQEKPGWLAEKERKKSSPSGCSRADVVGVERRGRPSRTVGLVDADREERAQSCYILAWREIPNDRPLCCGAERNRYEIQIQIFCAVKPFVSEALGQAGAVPTRLTSRCPNHCR